jgi:prephenate dehydrogenase
VGLIGGSFAAALRRHGGAARILGVGRHQSRSLNRAIELGLIDEAVTLEQAAAQADLIMLSVPVGCTDAVLAALEPRLRDHTVITDAGSTKANVVAAARQALGARVAQFVPGHPIAGAEKTGPGAADPELYQNRTVILTPLAENGAAARRLVTQAWERCGARVMTMEPDAHDLALASVSHVPHFLSSVFMDQVASSSDSDLRLGLAGTGFRDFTRIAAGSPEMWRDIFMANRAAVLVELHKFKAALAEAEQSLDEGNASEIAAFLERAALARRLWGSRSGLS